MLTKASIVLLLVCSLLGYNPQSLTSAELTIQQQSIQQQVEHFSSLNGVDPKLISKIIECESQGKQDARGDSKNGKYLAYGLFQYHKPSFDRHAKLYGEELDYYSSFDQIKLGIFAIANDMGREWTSFVAIKKGGTYSFYSKLLQKHYVVKCKLDK